MSDEHLAQANAAVDLRAPFLVLWRGRWIAMAMSSLCVAAALFVLSFHPPSFDAETQILLDTRDRRTVEYSQVVGDLAIDNAVVASEIAVIRSRRLLRAVAMDLSLDNEPEFAAPRPGLMRRAAGLLRPHLPALADRMDPPTPPRPPLEVAIDHLALALTAEQKGRSYVIRLAVRSGDPALSAKVANALADAYVRDQIFEKDEATRRASDWLSARIDALKQQSAQADAAVERYRAEQSVGDGQGFAVTEQQLAEINTQLVSARAARAEAEARHEQIRRLIDEKGERAAANVLSSPLILNLRQQRAEVRRREAELATRYGPKHPQMINVKAELRDIGAAIASELRKRVASLANDAEVARAREAVLVGALTDLEDRSTYLSRASVGLRQLEREATASRRIYEDLLARHKETTEQRGLQEADARVISRAAPASAPSSPRRGLISALAGASGLLLGFGFVFLAEIAANTYRTAAEAERSLGLQVVARLPLSRGARRRRRLLETLRQRPNSAFAEAIRGLRNRLVSTERPGRVALVTSAAPGEGKSSTCLALAQSCALMGRSAVVVECDFRRPSVTAALGPLQIDAPDLLDLLQGDASMEEVLRPLGCDGAYALALRGPAPQAADLLSSARFREVVAALAESHHLVLLDTPPAPAVPDAAAVAPAADETLMVVQWRHTPRQAAEACARLLREASAPRIGVVLSQIDPAREAAYEYAGFRRGAPNYGAYYSAG